MYLTQSLIFTIGSAFAHSLFPLSVIWNFFPNQFIVLPTSLSEVVPFGMRPFRSGSSCSGRMTSVLSEG